MMSQLADVNIQSSVGMFTFYDVLHFYFALRIKVVMCYLYRDPNVAV